MTSGGVINGGSGASPGGVSDPEYANDAGRGATATGRGQHGRVIIRY